MFYLNWFSADVNNYIPAKNLKENAVYIFGADLGRAFLRIFLSGEYPEEVANTQF